MEPASHQLFARFRRRLVEPGFRQAAQQQFGSNLATCLFPTRSFAAAACRAGSGITSTRRGSSALRTTTRQA